MSQLRFLVVLSIYGILGAAYTWPSPQLDELESLHYDQGGYNAHGSIFVGGVTPCTLFLFGNTPGRSNAAEWIRTVRLKDWCNVPRNIEHLLGVSRHGNLQRERRHRWAGRVHTHPGRAGQG